ncbi:hypothetical protein C0J52_08401 [Blattella germanica]|nr:hypothetical protein C0J52_08401 [Blattella germanica]
MYFVEAQDSTKKLSLYVKCLPKDSEKTKHLMAYLQFQNEASFYNKVLPEFQDLQKEKTPLDSISPLPIPHCYKAVSDGTNDIIILEDLTSKEFVVLDRLKLMNVPELFLTMKELGRFHSFSYALKKHRPGIFKEITGELVEPIYGEFYSKASGLLTNCLRGAMCVLKTHFREESEYLSKFEAFIEYSIEPCRLQAFGYSNEPYNVITHGDPWICNFMLRYQENCSEPDCFKFIDFQQTRYSSPAIDIGRIFFCYYG